MKCNYKIRIKAASTSTLEMDVHLTGFPFLAAVCLGVQPLSPAARIRCSLPDLN